MDNTHEDFLIFIDRVEKMRIGEQNSSLMVDFNYNVQHMLDNIMEVLKVDTEELSSSTVCGGAPDDIEGVPISDPNGRYVDRDRYVMYFVSNPILKFKDSDKFGELAVEVYDSNIFVAFYLKKKAEIPVKTFKRMQEFRLTVEEHGIHDELVTVSESCISHRGRGSALMQYVNLKR